MLADMVNSYFNYVHSGTLASTCFLQCLIFIFSFFSTTQGSRYGFPIPHYILTITGNIWNWLTYRQENCRVRKEWDRVW